tara:strand:+ start:2331 stop:2510 length:180 start_codon:yes stop_codon:yes gene_type:complete
MAIGIAVGTALGVALNNLALGVGGGVALGALAWIVFRARKGTVHSEDTPDTDPGGPDPD